MCQAVKKNVKKLGIGDQCFLDVDDLTPSIPAKARH